MKTGFTYIVLSMSYAFSLPAIASTNIIVNTQTANECGLNKIEVIVGGKVGIEKIETEQSTKCFISTVAGRIAAKSTHPLKLDKSLKQDRSANSLALKVNLYDTIRIADRNNILNSELVKAISHKNDLLKKKINGQTIDELQLSRIEADISALQREIAR